METSLNLNFNKVNSVLLTSLSRYCDNNSLLIKSIEDACDRMIVAELYDQSILTVKLVSAIEAEFEIFQPENMSRKSEIIKL